MQITHLDSGLFTFLVMLAATCFIALVIVFSTNFWRISNWWRVSDHPVSEDEEREKFYQYFLTDPELSRISNSDNTQWLLAEAKALVDRKVDAIKGYESKATTQFSILGSGIGIVTVLSGAELHHAAGAIWTLFLGGACLLLSLVCDIVCITTGRIEVLPYVDVYNYYKTLGNPKMLGPMQASLTEGYMICSGQFAAHCERKRRWLRTATILFVAGLTVLGANYAIASSRIQPEPTNIHLVP